jgi:hypothetical protein
MLCLTGGVFISSGAVVAQPSSATGAGSSVRDDCDELGVVATTPPTLAWVAEWLAGAIDVQGERASAVRRSS